MIPIDKLLADIPDGLRDELLSEYRGVVAGFLEERWKLAGLDAGRFCEVVYTILDGALSGKFPAKPSKPSKFPEACKALEAKPPIKRGDRSLRIMLPRALPPIYEVRNNRNIGHVGGDVVSNKMDAAYAVAACTFVFAELVRVFHDCTVAEAQASVDALVERRVPVVWDFGNGKRVLVPGMGMAEKCLVLLSSEPDWVDAEALCSWAKHSNPSVFRKSVLEQLDSRLLIEYDRKQGRCKLTPLGAKEAAKLLSKAQ